MGSLPVRLQGILRDVGVRDVRGKLVGSLPVRLQGIPRGFAGMIWR